MGRDFYSDPQLYDLMFPPGPYASFYAAEARRAGGPVLELACGTGQLLLPIASAGIAAAGLDLSPEMLQVARDRLRAAPAPVEFAEGDMRDFDLGGRFALVFVARNSLLHLHRTEELVACFRSVRRHLRPGGAFVFDIFNPDVRRLARLTGERFRVMEIQHPGRGTVTVEAEGEYDAAGQVTRERWYFSAAGQPHFWTAPLEVRSIFPQELPLLLEAGGFRVEARYGGLTREPFEGASPRQVCICRAAD